MGGVRGLGGKGAFRELLVLFDVKASHDPELKQDKSQPGRREDTES